MIYYKQKRWIKDAKGHEDQNYLDERTLLVSKTFSKKSLLKVLNPRYGKQWLLGFSWKIMPGVFKS